MVVFGHIYYFLGLLLFLANLGIILKLNKILKTQNWVQSFLKVTNKNPNKKDMPEGEYQDFVSFNSVMIVNFLWIFFGLISQSWKMFLLTLSIIFLINFLLVLFSKIKFLTNILNFTKVCIITVGIALLVINHFHIHIDMYEVIKQRFLGLF